MGWKGKFFGAVIGFMLTRSIWGAVMGALVGQLFDQYAGGAAARPAGARPGAARGSATGSAADVFFRTTFELMGHVAKSDGRVTEAEIDAARRLMQELRLGPDEINTAITCFRAGKMPFYNVATSVEQLRSTCAMRHDLLRAFMELQLRAALAGNGMSPPARAILTQVAGRLGMSGLEFARMEAGLRARQSGRPGERPSERATVATSLSESYAELEVEEGMTDQEITKAYRRQMSRHHPDKLVANGLPESMMQVAKEKTQSIQEAYEHIRTARGMR